jgi:hypothetical protein
MSKRQNRKSSTRTQSKQTVSSEAGVNTQNLPDNFNPDYSYVKKDLRTIGILAGIFLTILVVLSFFL